MTSGGARARSGPPPDRNAIRNGRSGSDWIRLPASGRKRPAPRFPLPDATERERAIWKREWRRPQAIQWEANGQELEVATYVRTFVESEQPGAKPALRGLVLRMQEYLGISQPGLARNRWMIVEDSRPAATVAEPSDPETPAKPVLISDARERIERMRKGGDDGA